MIRKLLLFSFLFFAISCSSSRDDSDSLFQGDTTGLPDLTGVVIDGRWRPLNIEARDIYYNEFKDGNFAAYTANGKDTLALGSYIPTPTGALVRYYSEVQKSEVQSVCVFETRDHLACTIGNSETIRLKRD